MLVQAEMRVRNDQTLHSPRFGNELHELSIGSARGLGRINSQLRFPERRGDWSVFRNVQLG